MGKIVDNKMNNEQMDALFRKVFDDVENGDEHMLGSLSGVAVDREETILTNLKLELKNLGEVPECQLSADRLRDAILSKGTMREPISPFANWWKFAVPVAACAALAVFVMQMPQSDSRGDAATRGSLATRVEPSVPTLENKIEPSDVVVPPVIEEKADETAPAVTDMNFGSESVKTDSAPVEKNTRRTTTTKPRPQYASRVVPSKQPDLGSAKASDVADLVAADLKPKSSPSVAGLAAGALKGFGKRDSGASADRSAKPSDSSPKVVIVTAGTDPNTRASNATEVDKKNVVFGG
jgi:hypothetical protein